MGHSVVIGSDGNALTFLKNELADLVNYVELPGYDVTYPKGKNMTFHLLKQMPRILMTISEEKKRIAQIVDHGMIDGIISDNRYGCRSDLVPSVFMTHQLQIKAPLMQQMISKLNQQFIHHFTETWIPDFANFPGLAGDLSHPEKMPAHCRYVGPISRFDSPVDGDNLYEVAAILSGPEPQRSMLETELIKKLKTSGKRSVLIKGQADSNQKETVDNLDIYGHLQSNQLKAVISRSEAIICRSGYTSIMDLYFLKKPAILIPTPGQTEQLYLAELHEKLGNFIVMEQGKVDLQTGLKAVKGVQGAEIRSELNFLGESLNTFVATL